MTTPQCVGTDRRPHGQSGSLNRRTMLRAAWSALSATSALMLVGCEVGPDYQAPQPTLQPFHNAAAVSARPTAPPARLDAWWTGFEDPLLDDLIRRALAQNLDLAAALARVREARAGAAGAGANLLPTLDATGDASVSRQSLNSPIGRLAQDTEGYSRGQRHFDVGPAASWEIDLFGGLRREREAALAETEAAEAELAGTGITLAADLADAYFQIRGYQARIAVVQQQIEVDTRLLDLIAQLRQRDLANDRELSQAQALLAQARTTLPPLKIALEIQLNRLDVLMGQQPGASAAELKAPSTFRPMPAMPAPDSPTDFLRRRPDVIAAERRLAAANAAIGAAIADYYPRVSLSGLLGFESVNASHFLSTESFQALGTGSIRWRLFDFGKIDAEVAQARGVDAAALASYRQAVLRAAEDVENAFIELTQTEQRTGEILTEVQALQRARDLSQQSFSAGIIPLTDVLDANRELLVAEDGLADNRAAAARAAVRSFRALGGGWDPSDLPPSSTKSTAS